MHFSDVMYRMNRLLIARLSSVKDDKTACNESRLGAASLICDCTRYKLDLKSIRTLMKLDNEQFVGILTEHYNRAKEEKCHLAKALSQD